MANLYGKVDGVECRACGATFAQPDKYGPFCKPCMNRVRYKFHGEKYSDNELNEWLARKLMLHILRLKKYGHVFRCEALTAQDQNGNIGYQCPNYAITKYTEKWVCSHHREHKYSFINDAMNPYLYLKNLISEISNKDEKFLKILHDISANEMKNGDKKC